MESQGIYEKYESIRRKIHDKEYSNKNIKKLIIDFEKNTGDMKLAKKLRRKMFFHRRLKFWFRTSYGRWERYEDVWLQQQDEPLVTVIVPNYNHSLYLRERIDCILNQTFQNFELILMDDCSTDNSKDILLSYKNHPKVSHVVINEQNTGNTFMQWEKGVKMARGKYIWIAESDDYADETFLETTVSAFCYYPTAVISRSGSYQVNSIGRVKLRDWDHFEEDDSCRFYTGADYIRHFMLHFNFIYNASMVLFRKDVFEKIDKTYMKLRYTGDWLCWIEMLKHGDICETRRKLNYFRQHSNKVSVKGMKTYNSILNQFDVLRYAMQGLPLSRYRRAIIKGENYNILYYLDKYNKLDGADINKIAMEHLGATPLHHRLYKINKKWSEFLPFLVSDENDIRRGNGRFPKFRYIE